MRPEKFVQAIEAIGGSTAMASVASRALQNDLLRGRLVTYADRRIMAVVDQSQRPGRPRRIAEDKRDLVLGLVHSIDRAFDSGQLSRETTKGLFRSLILNVLLRSGREAAVREFKSIHDGFGPPFFMTIGPGKACNLRCTGCYASSTNNTEKLEWDVLERIIDEAKQLWGCLLYTSDAADE